MNMLEPEISIVVPVFNEAQNALPLAQLILNIMRNLGKSFELIIVNDGSTDNTQLEVSSLPNKYPEVRVINLAKNTGQSLALEAGVKLARAEVIVNLDGDLQNDPEDIPCFLEALNESDMVVGIRKNRKDSWVKRASARVAYKIRNAVLKDGVIDIGCGIKAYKRACLEGIEWFDGIHRFLPALVKFKGFKVAQIEVNHNQRRSGKSKYSTCGRAFKGLKDLIYVSRLKRRLT